MARYAPDIVKPDLMIPDDLQRLTPLHGIIHPTAVDRGHHHLAGFQQTYRLFAFLPPFNVGFDPVQYREGSIDTGVGGQHLIDLVPRNTVETGRASCRERV